MLLTTLFILKVHYIACFIIIKTLLAKDIQKIITDHKVSKQTPVYSCQYDLSRDGERE